MGRGGAPSATTRLVYWRTARRRVYSGSAGYASRVIAFTGTAQAGLRRPGSGRRDSRPLLEDAAHLGADAVQFLSMGLGESFQHRLAFLGEAQVRDTAIALGAGAKYETVGFQAIDQAHRAVVPHTQVGGQSVHAETFRLVTDADGEE